jgi:uncharacterized membrane protein YtjA (UPF0391 family)
MLYYALVVFFIISIIASAFGFGGIAAGATGIAKILFVIFLAVFLVTLDIGLIRRLGILKNTHRDNDRFKGQTLPRLPASHGCCRRCLKINAQHPPRSIHLCATSSPCQQTTSSAHFWLCRHSCFL